MINKRLKIILFSLLIIVILIASRNKSGYKQKLEIPKLTEVFKQNMHIDYSSQYIYILDRQTKEEKYEKNSKTKAYPASLTKVMTVLVALENIEDLSEVSPIDVETYKYMVNENASMAGFFGRELVTYRDLLYGTMLPSGGEAANSLAINISGSIEEFVKLMNGKVEELGLTDTHFTNAEGLQDEKQQTTAYDMAKILDHALENKDFRAIFTSKNFTTTSTADHPDGLALESTVLSELDGVDQQGFNIIGGKSGTTSDAGQCWITLGTKDDLEYIVVVMGAPLNDIKDPDMSHMQDTLELYKKITAPLLPV